MLPAMAMKESDLNFFRPLWIRLLVTAVCVTWFAAEALFSRDPLWLGITGVAIIYCVWNFFLRWPKDLPPAATKGGEPPVPPSGPGPAGPTQP